MWTLQSESLDGHLTDEVVRGGGEGSPAVVILVLVDVDGGEDGVVQLPRDLLRLVIQKDPSEGS